MSFKFGAKLSSAVAALSLLAVVCPLRSGLAIDDVEVPPMTKSIAAVQKMVSEAWNPKTSHDILKARVSFNVSDEGKASGIELTQSSGNDDFDDEAENAVKSAQPFDELPKPVSSVRVNITFLNYYNVIHNRLELHDAATEAESKHYDFFFKGKEKFPKVLEWRSVKVIFQKPKLSKGK